MSDTYLKFANSFVGKQVAPRLGLPQPPVLKRYVPGQKAVDGAVLVGQADGGRLAFLVINFVTMGLPVGCLWLSRNALGLDDPISDNISANVIGLAMGLVARFYLFRRFVFRRPVHLHRSRQPQPVSEPTDRSTGDPARPPVP